MRELDRISIDWLCSHALIATLAFYLLMAVRQFSPEIGCVRTNHTVRMLPISPRWHFIRLVT